MHVKEVESLRNLALKCSFYALKSAIETLPKPKDWSFHDCCSLMEKKLENYHNWKEVNEIVKYHRPYREFLSAAQKYEDYFKLVNYDLHLNINGDPLCFLIFWLCYENEETIRFDSERSISSNGTVILHALMKKNQVSIFKCKEASLSLHLNDEPNFENARDLLKRMSRVESLHASFNCYDREVFVEKIFSEEISGFNHLTTLTTSLGNKDGPMFTYLSLFVKNSPKILKKLQVYDFSATCVQLKLFLESITQLHDLKTLNIDITPTMEEIIDRFDENIVITSVRSMKVWIESFSSLNFIDKFFNCVEGLTIMYGARKFEIESMTQEEMSKLENSLCGMSKLQMIKNLTLFYEKEQGFPLKLPALWKIFPNVTTFGTFEIYATESDLDFIEVKSIEKLVVVWGKIWPPHILTKMPNLKEIIFDVRRTFFDISEANRKFKPFLPKDCEIIVSELKSHGHHGTCCIQYAYMCVRCP